MRHRWMFYNPETLAGASAPEPPNAQPAEPPAPQPEKAEHMIPKARFDEINTQLRQLQAEKAQREQAAKKQEEDAAKQRGEWEKLATDREQELETLKPAAERAATYERLLNQQISDQIKDWPDALKALDPGKGNLEARLEWVKNAAKIAAELKKTQRPAPTEGGAHHNNQNQQPNQNQQQSQQPSSYSFQKSGDVRW